MLKALKKHKIALSLALVGLVCLAVPFGLSRLLQTGICSLCRLERAVGETDGGSGAVPPPATARHFLEELLHGLGEALLIASALALTVDYLLKKELVKEVSSFIRGAHLPIEIRREIDHLLRTEIYRSDFTLVCELEELNGQVMLKKRVTYIVNNPTYTVQSYDYPIGLQKVPGREAKIIRVGVIGALDSKTKADADFDDIQPKVTEGKKELTWKRTFLIPAESVGRTQFMQETSQSFDTTDDLTIYITQPTVRFSISVKYPDSLDVGVYFGYHDRGAVKAIPEERPSLWTLNRALLRSAITISWNPTDTATKPVPKSSPFDPIRNAWNRIFHTPDQS